MSAVKQSHQQIGPAIQQTGLPPITVGRYLHGDETRFLPFSAQELERAADAYGRRIGTFHFRTGEHVLQTALYDESAQFLAFERELSRFGLVLCPGDASLFDAARSESIVRRFGVTAVMGVNGALLDGLVALGHDPAQVPAGPVVWARPDAYERLKGIDGIRLYRWMEIGPAVAVECAAGAGAHIDAVEWKVEQENGEIVLSSRLHRCVTFDRYRTGISAKVDHTACSCGSADPRVVL
jgi:phenylacetate-coenzyme A ligase PaaK-like adenylate-forming protein